MMKFIKNLKLLVISCKMAKNKLLPTLLLIILAPAGLESCIQLTEETSKATENGDAEMAWIYSENDLKQAQEIIIGKWNNDIQDIKQKILTISLPQATVKVNKIMALSEFLVRVTPIANLTQRKFGIKIKKVTVNDSQILSAMLLDEFQLKCTVRHKQLVVKAEISPTAEKYDDSKNSLVKYINVTFQLTIVDKVMIDLDLHEYTFGNSTSMEEWGVQAIGDGYCNNVSLTLTNQGVHYKAVCNGDKPVFFLKKGANAEWIELSNTSGTKIIEIGIKRTLTLRILTLNTDLMFPIAATSEGICSRHSRDMTKIFNVMLIWLVVWLVS